MITSEFYVNAGRGGGGGGRRERVKDRDYTNKDNRFVSQQHK